MASASHRPSPCPLLASLPRPVPVSLPVFRLDVGFPARCPRRSSGTPTRSWSYSGCFMTRVPCPSSSGTRRVEGMECCLPRGARRQSKRIRVPTVWCTHPPTTSRAHDEFECAQPCVLHSRVFTRMHQAECYLWNHAKASEGPRQGDKNKKEAKYSFLISDVTRQRLLQGKKGLYTTRARAKANEAGTKL